MLTRFTLALRVVFCSDKGLRRVSSALAVKDRLPTARADLQKNAPRSISKTGSLSISSEQADQWSKDIREEAIGKRITGRIVQSLVKTRNLSELAVLAIGAEITALFDIAVNNNDAVRSSLRKVVSEKSQSVAQQNCEDPCLESDDQTIHELVEEIRTTIHEFVRTAEDYFRRQSSNAEEAWARFENVAKSVSEIEEIAMNSKVLAINAKVESARLGERGAAFAIVSNHLANFSDSIQHANHLIEDSMGLMRDSMEQSRSAALTVEDELGAFTKRLVNEVEGVESQTRSLTDSILTMLNQINASSDDMIRHTRSALSELQFQDPMVQGLKRTEHEVNKLYSLLENGFCDDVELADIDEIVGNDGTLEREAGVVELF